MDILEDAQYQPAAGGLYSQIDAVQPSRFPLDRIPIQIRTKPLSLFLFYNTLTNTHLIISLTAAVIIAVVLCTAGCIDAPSDAIAGDWVSETDGSVSYAVFEEGGIGHFAGDAGGAVFTWAAAEPKGTYTLAFADGAAETAVLDAVHGLMTIGEVVYQKYPSGYSGAAVKWYVATGE